MSRLAPERYIVYPGDDIAPADELGVFPATPYHKSLFPVDGLPQGWITMPSGPALGGFA